MSQNPRYGMVIDTKHCVGCQTCTVSCKISNEVPGSAHWNHMESLTGDVLYQPTGTFPACVANCPTGAMHKEADTRLVLVNQDVCIGCGYCDWTCPYGSPSMDDVNHVMSKCTFCKERILEGIEPYCVASCPANARIFGDLNDPESEVSKLIAAEHGEQYLPKAGTSPCVYYI